MLLLLLLGAALILFDRERIIANLGDADWRVLPGALLFVALAHGLVSYSYILLARLVEIRMPTKEIGVAYFTTNVMNRVIRSFGAAGFSLRYWIMKPYGVSLKDVLNSSFLHFLLGSLILLAILPFGILYTLLFANLPPALFSLLILTAVIGLAMVLGNGFILFSNRLREVVANLTVWLARKVIRRDVSQPVTELTQHASRLMGILHQAPLRFSAVIALLLAELLANVIIFGYCLRGFGASLGFIETAVVYLIGTLVGVMTALPGGIGVQEAMMTSLAMSLGISFEQGVLAALLFRILQTFLPYLVSVIFYPHLLKAGEQAANASDARV